MDASRVRRAMPLVLVLVASAFFWWRQQPISLDPYDPRQSTTSRRNLPPDIAVVLLDTLRRDRVSAYGYHRPTTPTIDRVALDGRLFRDAYSTSSWTAPAHASLFTGLYPIGHRTTQELWSLSQVHPTLAERLAQAGYQTVAVVGNPMVGRARGFARGFEIFRESWKTGIQLRKRTEDEFAALWVSEFLQRRRDDRPLFLFVNLIGIHSPFDSCGVDCGRFGADPANGPVENRWQDYYVGRAAHDAATFTRLSNLYDAEVHHADRVVGHLLRAIEAHRHPEEVVLVITSDHGENLGEHDHIDHVFTLYEPTIRIPLIVRYPSAFPPGSTDETPTQLVDLSPTILDLAGVRADPGHGIDLRQARARAERPVFAEYYRPVQATRALLERIDGEGAARLQIYQRRIRTVLRNGWKLIWGSDHRHELYHLAEDMEEGHDLVTASASQDRLRKLLTELEQTVVRYDGGTHRAGELAPIDPSSRRQLEQLGYLE